MQENNVTSLREMLEQLPTSRLDEMLHLELQKEPPDPDAVRLILGILEEREKNLHEEPTPQQIAAWEKYQQRIAESSLRPKKVRRWNWVWRAASAAVLVFVLIAFVPQRVEAEGFWGILSRWKESFLEFLDPEEKRVEAEKGYNTDHPGLQQVYDTVVAELGITDPMLPEWLEDECILLSCQVIHTPNADGAYAVFADGNKEIALNVDNYVEKYFHKYYRDGDYSKTYEKEGVQFDITRNNDKWVAVWTKDNIEYFLTIDCQEDTLQRILKSIYVMEAN